MAVSSRCAAMASREQAGHRACGGPGSATAAGFCANGIRPQATSGSAVTAASTSANAAATASAKASETCLAVVGDGDRDGVPDRDHHGQRIVRRLDDADLAELEITCGMCGGAEVLDDDQ